ncbi:MAG: HEAT repeat domain-containing protein [Akkermansiaceae bacterium]|nr:HEAT repeat domain-containing protein [Akkermansiaceae bacterium]MCP5542767.1 HEAT repeat domain-containing protein [Akkermansiaceae bacterium]MCP5548815.1 HEAT repeat domain-containing protein [Akkermansiaceae bacterium]
MSQRVQRNVNRPVSASLSRQIREMARQRTEAKYMGAGLSLEETIARFLDEDTPMSERRVHAFRLAMEHTREADAVLRRVLAGAAAEDRACMAELIGQTRSSRAQKWLWPLLGDSDESVVLAAIRGLSMIGGDKVSSGLEKVLTNREAPETVRLEAAVALGAIGSDLSQTALLDALGQGASEALATEILRGLGQSEFSLISPVFSSYLAAPSTTSEMRVVAIEALAYSSDDAIDFLLETAAGDSDPEVRASAAWAVSAHQTVNHLGGPLAEMAVSEPEPDVRRRLYEAMLCQVEVPADPVLPAVMAEEDAAARIAGFNVLGNLARQQPSSEARATFDRQVATELRRLATGENSLNLQMRAVFALRRAGTPAAMQALAAIAEEGNERISAAARNGLRASTP